MAYFPMFIDLTNQDCLIIGGGEVAYRKVKALLDFDARVTVIAKKVSQKISTIADSDNKVFIEERQFEEADLQGRRLVVVATNDNELNSLVSEKCNQAGIPVNVVDDQEKCSFIFSSYIKEKDIVGAFSSSGKSPVITQYLRDKEREVLTPKLGEINDFMGVIRRDIIEAIPEEANRKDVFKKILEYALWSEELPKSDELDSFFN